MSAHLLEVQGLCKRFGGLSANENVSFVVDRAEIIGLIGPNGAGKTTVFNCLAGFHVPSAGRRGTARHCAHLPDRAHVSFALGAR